MNIAQRLIRPLHQALQVFFVRDVQLRRGKAGVELVLAERGSAAQAGRLLSRAEQADIKERAELTLMQSQLAVILDDSPDTRHALRHLVFVEQALMGKGWKALHRLPVDILQHALQQLEDLVTNWSPEGLANLRSKMAVAIIDREHADSDARADAYRTAMPMEAADRIAEVEAVQALQMATTEVPVSGPVQSEDDALAAAYAALGLGQPDSDTPPAPEPKPAELATQALAQLQASAAATLKAADANPNAEAMEYHLELGSHSAKAQPRDNLAGRGRLEPIKLRELES